MRRFYVLLSLLLLLLLAACSNAPAPTVSILSPADGAEVDDATVTVTGTVNSSVTSLSYTLDEGEPQDVTITEGGFSFDVTLEPGESTITVTANGNAEISDSVTVNYTLPDAMVTILSPEDGAALGEDTVTVTGVVNDTVTSLAYTLNDGEPQEVTVVDGGFSFDVTLQPGENTITVIANGDPEISTSITVTYNIVVEPGFESQGTVSAEDPTFVRPNGGTLTEAQLTVPYDALEFSVSEQGYYEIYSAQQYDGYLLLYAGAFDPADPTTNLIDSSDDFEGAFDPENDPPGQSRILAELSPDTTYTLVITVFASDSVPPGGDYSIAIRADDPPPPPDQLPPPDNSGYNITLRFTTDNLTARQQLVFEDAAARWQTIITGDVANIEGFVLPAGAFFPGTPPVEGTLDDVFIDVAFSDLDGPSGLLGRAGPVFVRPCDDLSAPDACLSVYGIMEFDINEFAEGGFFNEQQQYEDVITHEMGHVLGIGTLWEATENTEGILQDPPTVPPGIPNPDYDPRFIGDAAVIEYQGYLAAAGRPSEDSVPIANTGGPGNYNGHWREITFDNELMTPYAGGLELLSTMTAASLGDVGYTVDITVDAVDADYVLPPPYVPGEFRQTAPETVEYVEGKDFIVASDSPQVFSVGGGVVNVDLNLVEVENSTSGCEASDYTDLVSGKIALVRRGTCSFEQKVLNALDAGAIGVILMNQGNGEDRQGLLNPALGDATDTIPVVWVTYDLGVELANTAGLQVEIERDAPAEGVISTQAIRPSALTPINEILVFPQGTISADGKITPIEDAREPVEINPPELSPVK